MGKPGNFKLVSPFAELLTSDGVACGRLVSSSDNQTDSLMVLFYQCVRCDKVVWSLYAAMKCACVQTERISMHAQFVGAPKSRRFCGACS